MGHKCKHPELIDREPYEETFRNKRTGVYTTHRVQRWTCGVCGMNLKDLIHEDACASNRKIDGIWGASFTDANGNEL